MTTSNGNNRFFIALAPVLEKKRSEEDVEAARKILCPPHPTDPQRYVQRIGTDKAGHYLCYFTVRGAENVHGWSRGEELSATKFREVRALLETGVIEPHAGPTVNSSIFYHKDEVDNPSRKAGF